MDAGILSGRAYLLALRIDEFLDFLPTPLRRQQMKAMPENSQDPPEKILYAFRKNTPFTYLPDQITMVALVNRRDNFLAARVSIRKPLSPSPFPPPSRGRGDKRCGRRIR